MKISSYCNDELQKLITTVSGSTGYKIAISEPLVMASAAGWYIGELCIEEDMPELVQPYARLTDYFETEDRAIEYYEASYFDHPDDFEDVIDTTPGEGYFDIPF